MGVAKIFIPITFLISSTCSSAADIDESRRAAGGFQERAELQQFVIARGTSHAPYHPINRDQPFAATQDGVAVYVDHVPSQHVTGSVVPVVQIFDEHMPAVSAVFSDSETVSGEVWVAFAALDPDTRKPQVVVTRNQGGGAKCCFLTTVFSKAGSGWERIEAPYQYGDVHYRLIDLDGDGYFELLGLDSEYIAAGGDRKPGPIPVRAYALRGTELRNVTAGISSDPEL